MANLKATLKLILFLLVTGFYYSVILIGYVLSIFGLDKIAWAATIRYIWAKKIIKILNMKLTVIGDPPIPPFFLVSNHLSYIDVWVLFASAKGSFVAKSDLRDWPVVGFVMATSGMIFVNRKLKADVRRVNDEIATKLTTAQGIFLFPEGTTSSGKEILPFKSSLFQFAAQKNIAVTSAAISYSTPDDPEFASKSLCWWDETPFLPHFWTLLKTDRFEASISFSSEQIQNSDRKYLAKRTEEIIKDLFNPVFHS